LFAGAAAIAIGLACSPALAQEREDVFAVQHAALEALAARCDLVVKCKITDAVDPQKMYLQCPGLEATAPTEIYYKYAADTEFPLKDANGLWPGKVAVTLPAGGVPVVVYTPAKPRKAKDDPTPDAFYLPKLEKGKTYLLLLVKLPGTEKNVYYLPNNPQCVQAPDEEHVAAMKKALDQTAWPWSKPVNGLQMAMFASCEELPQRQRATAESAGQAGLLLHVSLAVRNASDKPMAVNLNECDEYIEIAAGNGGKAIKGDVYKPREPGEAVATTGPSMFGYVILAPGDVAFVTPYGAEAGDFSIPLRVASGKWALTASYKSGREGKGYRWDGKMKQEQPLWQGTVEAKCDLEAGKSGSGGAPAAP
jgi:hypothetical protein